jgi:hypothetical protein
VAGWAGQAAGGGTSVKNPASGQTTRLAMSGGGTECEHGIDELHNLESQIRGVESWGIPSRMTTPTTGRTCEAGLPMLPLVVRASDRVPRSSRFREADSVRFVRLNMA